MFNLTLDPRSLQLSYRQNSSDSGGLTGRNVSRGSLKAGPQLDAFFPSTRALALGPGQKQKNSE